ncbi:MAG: PAS domain S-box protein [Mariprofundus sp.]|nr:PAS domain S-box protein [Mariprofundus sp.]
MLNTISMTYLPSLVLLSVFIAVISSYISFGIAGRVVVTRSALHQFYWMLGGGIAMGSGIWSMHFIGMLAMVLPFTVAYDVGLTVLSLIAAIVFGFLAFLTMNRLQEKRLARMLGSISLAIGVVSMHFIGMAAIKAPVEVSYDLSMVFVSAFISFVISYMALTQFNNFKNLKFNVGVFKKLPNAIVMGVGISAVHYVAMEAAAIHVHSGGINTDLNMGLVFAITIIVFLIQGGGALVILMDENIYAKEKINHLEIEFRNMVENIQDCLYRTDADGRLIYASPSITTLMAFDLDEIIGTVLSDYYVEADDRKKLMKLLLSSSGGEVKGFETRIKRKDGEIIWVSVNTHLIYNAAGEINGVEGTIRDISSMKQVEGDLRKLSQAVEQAGESIIIINRAGVLEYVNAAFTKLTGYSSEDVIGQTPALMNSEEQDAEFYDNMWETITSGHVWSGKIIDKKMDGSLFPARLTISPIFDEAREITHFVGVNSDLTEIEKLAEQFRQSQKMESIGVLVGGIAHDFNNILAAITGAAFLAKRKFGNDKSLTNIESQAERAADIVKQLLAFARKDIHQKEVISVCDVVEKSTQLFKLTVPENIQLNVDVCQDRLLIRGDETQLQQVIMNLVNNARDALLESDTPVITISVQAKKLSQNLCLEYSSIPSDQYACIAVSDNGHGIDESHFEEIFEPFFTRKEVGKGTGLGLAMVKGTVESHDGIIDVESVLGEGTTFSIYLPLLDISTDMSNMDIMVMDVNSDSLAVASGECILLVDDESELREVNSAILEELGYQVIEAADGLQAVEKFNANKQHVRLIIMDIVMPRMGGIRAAELIRQISAAVPIIFATGYDPSQVLGNAESGLSNSVIMTKPFKVDELHKSIDALI